MTYDNTNSGFICENQNKREGKKDADLKGSLNVEGKEYWVSCWKNAKGYGVKLSKKEPKQEQVKQPAAQKQKPAQQPLTDGFDDDIPF